MICALRSASPRVELRRLRSLSIIVDRTFEVLVSRRIFAQFGTTLDTLARACRTIELRVIPHVSEYDMTCDDLLHIQMWSSLSAMFVISMSNCLFCHLLLMSLFELPVLLCLAQQLHENTISQQQNVAIALNHSQSRQ